MEEKIQEVATEATEKVIEKTVEYVDPETLKDLGVFGAGAVVGIIVYRKALVPAWRWIQKKRRPKTHVVKKTKPDPEEVEDFEDEEPAEDDPQE